MMWREVVCGLGGAVFLALAGCSGESAVRPGSSAGVMTGASSSEPSVPRVRFRLAADGLPMDGRWKSTPIVADVNRDGAIDVAAHPRLGTGPRVWLANGKGGWIDSSQGLTMERSCGGGLAFADINNDGKLDLAVADHCSGVWVYLGDGQGRWPVATEKLTPDLARAKETPGGADPTALQGAEALAVGDVNGDGFQDMVVSSSDQGGFTVYLGDGSGRNWKERKGSGLPNGETPEPGDIYFGGFAFDMKLVDVNRDGRLDLVASYITGPRVWWGDGGGRFEDHSQGLIKTTYGGIYARIATADVDNDGRLDLVVGNAINGVEVYLQNADGSWRGPIDPMPELKGGAQAVALCDLDGDGNVDVIIGGGMTGTAGQGQDPWGLFVRFGDGKGGWASRPGTNLPAVGMEVVWGIACADVNGDGRPDVVVSSGGVMGKSSVPGVGPTGQAGRVVVREEVDSKRLGAAPQWPVYPHVQVWINDGGSR